MNTLLFLHGFLGTKEDWTEILPFFSLYHCVAIDLPGHGSTSLTGSVLEQVQTVVNAHHQPFLIGYSLGGRIALQLADQFPEAIAGVIVLSAHPGLKEEAERMLRWKQDLEWCDKLEHLSMTAFLKAWYEQPVFQSLKCHPIIETLLTRRAQQNPQLLAQVLREMSLAKQGVARFHPHTLFLYGEEDLKYAEIYSKLPSSVRVQGVPGAGHAIHLENPQGCAEHILSFLKEHYAVTRVSLPGSVDRIRSI